MGLPVQLTMFFLFFSFNKINDMRSPDQHVQLGRSRRAGSGGCGRVDGISAGIAPEVGRATGVSGGAAVAAGCDFRVAVERERVLAVMQSPQQLETDCGIVSADRQNNLDDRYRLQYGGTSTHTGVAC